MNTFLDDARWARLRDKLFVAVALAAIVAFFLTSYITIQTNRTVAQINRRQLEFVQEQNAAQLCSQYDIIVNFRRGFERLGLPVNDIRPPDITGLDCG